MRVGVLNNLRAGRAGPPVSPIFEVLRSRPDVVHVETDSAQVLPEALAELESHEVDVLAINGGDGTLQYALSELLGDPDRRPLPAIAPLRGGRTNMSACDFGAQRSAARGLLRVIEAADAKDLEPLVVRRPVLRVRSNRRADVQYGMFFGAGIIYRAIGLVHRLFPPGRSQGLLGASLVTAALVTRMLFRPSDGILTPDKCNVRFGDGEGVDGELYLLMSTTLERLFLRMNPFWGAGGGGVRLTALESRAEGLARATPGILRGRPRPWLTPKTGYTSTRCERSSLRLDCGFTIDGELFDPIPDESIELGADRRITFLRA